jgi:flagellin
MALGINTNVTSLNAQRNLGRTQDMLSTSMQRLTSGLRINSAKDDAAGLAISDRFTAQIRGLNQAVRNSNDGISMAQTGEGALQETTNMLQRLRELAVQSANDTNTAGDRQKIQKEVNSLIAELDRISTTTQFNGKTLFDGNFGTATFQVGANANQTIEATVGNFRTAQYGNNQVTGTAAAGAAASRIATGKAIVVSGAIASGTYTTAANDTAKSIADGINRLGTGVTASARTELDISFSSAGSYALTVKSDNSSAKTIAFQIGGATGSDNLAAAVKAFNDVAGETGVTAKVNSAGTGVTLVNATGNDITLGDTITANAGNVSVGSTTLTGGTNTVADTAVINGQVILDSDRAFNVTDAASSGFAVSGTSALKAVSTLDVSSAAKATDALKIVDAALSSVDDQRAYFGALQNRFESTIANLQNVSENLSGARGRIQDADFAAETASLTRSQILQQAGIAMLAQANQSQQTVLSLLR